LEPIHIGCYHESRRCSFINPVATVLNRLKFKTFATSVYLGKDGEQKLRINFQFMVGFFGSFPAIVE